MVGLEPIQVVPTGFAKLHSSSSAYWQDMDASTSHTAFSGSGVGAEVTVGADSVGAFVGTTGDRSLGAIEGCSVSGATTGARVGAPLVKGVGLLVGRGQGY